MTKSIIIAITGASGAIFGQKLLELLKNLEINTHLIISKSARLTIKYELEKPISYLEELATKTHKPDDISACISSGSSNQLGKNLGMIIAPCSMKTLGEIAHSITSNLISRSADVCLKERRKLVILPRETPLNLSHIENMKQITLMNGIIAPPVPAFYNKPKNIDEIITHNCVRVLDLFDIETNLINRWQ